MSFSPLLFYLLETHFEVNFGNNGKLFLIGKVLKNGKPANCTLTLIGLPKYLYFLRHDIDYSEYPGIIFPKPTVSAEIANFLHINNITKFTCRLKWMRYLFSEEFPFQGNYTEVKVPVNSVKNMEYLHNYKGNEYFKLLCPKMNLLEIFQYTYQVKSNCWLSFQNIQKGTIFPDNNYLQFDVSSGNIKINVISSKPPPILTLGTLQIFPTVDKNGYETIGCISCATYKYQLPWQEEDSESNTINESCEDMAKSFTLLTAHSKTSHLSSAATSCIMPDERSLLENFIANLLSYDPDIIVTYDWYGHDRNLICDRLQRYGLTTSTVLSRVKRLLVQPGTAQFRRERKQTVKVLFPEMLLTGRLICDIRTRCKDYPWLNGIDLASLAGQLLDEKACIKDLISDADFVNAQTIRELVTEVKKQVGQIVKITMNLGILPNCYKLSSLHCCLLNSTLRYSNLFRTESMITFEFFSNRTMLPVFGYKPRCEDRMLKGGTVIEPIPGLYKTIVLCLDFKALYPSIIIEDNLCFEDNYATDTGTVSNYITNSTGDVTPARPHPKSFTVLPALAKRLLSAREHCQRPTATKHAPTTLATHDTFASMQSNSYKLASNCLFGGLASRLSKFYALRVAEAIAQRGRGLLNELLIQIHSVLGFTVIYGDTDSVFVDTGLAGSDCSAANWERANEIVKSVTTLVDGWEKGKFQLKCDGLYTNFLLVKKKSYCGTSWIKNNDGTDQFTVNYKGMDCTRRDNPPFCNDIAKTMIGSLLNTHEVSETVRNRWLLDISESITKLTAKPRDPIELLFEQEDDWTTELIEKICSESKRFGERHERMEESNQACSENDNSDTVLLLSSENESEMETDKDAKRLAEEMSPSVKQPAKKCKSTKPVVPSDSDDSDVVCIDISPTPTKSASCCHSNPINPDAGTSSKSMVRTSETSRRPQKQRTLLFQEIISGNFNLNRLTSTCHLSDSVTIHQVTPSSSISKFTITNPGTSMVQTSTVSRVTPPSRPTKVNQSSKRDSTTVKEKKENATLRHSKSMQTSSTSKATPPQLVDSNVICPPVTKPPPIVSSSYPALFKPVNCQPFVMRMQLTRDLSGYSCTNQSPHVTAAIRFNVLNSTRRPFKKGDIIPFVICRDDSNLSPAKSAYHPDDYDRCGFPIDLDYYIKTKLYRCLQYIFDPISSPLKKLTDEDLKAVLGINTDTDTDSNNNNDTYCNPAIMNILLAYSKLAIIKDKRHVNIKPLAKLLDFKLSDVL